MRRIFLVCALLSACSTVPRPPETGQASPRALAIVEAPRPNSERYTTEQAHQALAALLPQMPAAPRTHPALAGWRGPSPGFHAHIDKQGALTADGVEVDLEGLKAASQNALNMVDSVPISVLLTTELPPDDPRLQRMVDALFEPAIQLYVLK